MADLVLCEDDFALRLSLAASLRGAGHEVRAVASAEEADLAVAARAPELCVLDWNLPGRSGLDLLRGWRAAGRTFPVILLTARDAVADRVEGLEAGADDYVVKPFATEEVLARIGVRLRGRAGAQPAAPAEPLRLSGREVDLAREVVRGGGDGGDEEVRLTTQEARALAYLASHPGRTIPRVELLREVWGYRGAVQTRAVDNTIFRLRAKVELDPADPRHVLTVHGEGYRFEP